MTLGTLQPIGFNTLDHTNFQLPAALALAMSRDGSSGGVIRTAVITETGVEREVSTRNVAQGWPQFTWNAISDPAWQRAAQILGEVNSDCILLSFYFEPQLKLPQWSWPPA